MRGHDRTEYASVTLGRGAHVRCLGKGCCTPITRYVSTTIEAWLAEPSQHSSDVLFPTIYGDRLSPDAVQYIVAKYVRVARLGCSSLKHKRLTPPLASPQRSDGTPAGQRGLLGHESVETTQVYLHAHIALKEAALSKIAPLESGEITRYQLGDQLLEFLNSL